MREYLKTIEKDIDLGEFGCNAIENAIDSLTEKFDLTDEEVERLSGMIGVGVTFEIDCGEAQPMISVFHSGQGSPTFLRLCNVPQDIYDDIKKKEIEDNGPVVFGYGQNGSFYVSTFIDDNNEKSTTVTASEFEEILDGCMNFDQGCRIGFHEEDL